MQVVAQFAELVGRIFAHDLTRQQIDEPVDQRLAVLDFADFEPQTGTFGMFGGFAMRVVFVVFTGVAVARAAHF